MKHFILILIIGLFSMSAVAQSNQKTKTKKEFIEVAFLSNGDIVVDGKKTNQNALIPKLEALEKKKGEVHYYQAPKIKQIHLNIPMIKMMTAYMLHLNVRFHFNPIFSNAYSSSLPIHSITLKKINKYKIG